MTTYGKIASKFYSHSRTDAHTKLLALNFVTEQFLSVRIKLQLEAVSKKNRNRSIVIQ